MRARLRTTARWLWHNIGRPLWQRYRPPWSLRRASTLRLWREAQLPWSSKLRELAAAVARPATSSSWLFLWVTGASVGLLWAAPADWTVSALSKDADARSFLQTLWQVDAAAIGLSVAIVLFAFELVWSTRYRGTLRRFAREIGLIYVLALGLAALFTIGADLLGLGAGAPGGWAATWATASSGMALASLPVLLLRAVAATDPERLHERNLQQVRELTVAATQRDIFRRLALGILKEEANSAGVDVQAFWFGDAPPGARYIYPPKAGTVADIRLRRARRIGSGVAGSQAGAVPAVLAELGTYVGPDTPIAIVPTGAGKGKERAARGYVKISEKRARDPLRRAIEKLHEAALEAVHSGLPVTYEDITDEYVEVLTALPTAWKRYGVDFEGGAAGGALFELTPLDLLVDNLWEELREATQGTSREVASTAFFLPYRVAFTAVGLNAGTLLTKMFALYVQLYPIVRTAQDPDIRRLLLNHSIEHPASLTKTAIAYELEKDTLTEHRREQLEKLLTRAFSVFAELAKVVMDEDPADAETISKINSNWSEIFQHWTPEHDAPQPYEIEWAERNWGDQHENTIALRERGARRERMVKTKREADLWRSALRFGLAFWAYHRLQQTRDAVWLQPLDTFRGYFGSLGRLTRAADRAIRYDERGPWFYWRLNQTRGSGPQAGPAVDWEMIRACLVLAVFHVNPSLPAPTIERPQFLEHQLPEVERILNAVRTDAQLWALVPPPDHIDRRWAMLRRALRDAV